MGKHTFLSKAQKRSERLLLPCYVCPMFLVMFQAGTWWLVLEARKKKTPNKGMNPDFTSDVCRMDSFLSPGGERHCF